MVTLGATVSDTAGWVGVPVGESAGGVAPGKRMLLEHPASSTRRTEKVIFRTNWLALDLEYGIKQVPYFSSNAMTLDQPRLNRGAPE